jgi:hypothetical protein
MTQAIWQFPIDIRLERAAGIRTITTSVFAFECLTTNWPAASHGPSYYLAILACFDAEDGKASHESARGAFLCAADDALITA